MNAAQYNERQRTRNAWDYADIALLVRYYQEHEGLSPEDGMLGPATVRHLRAYYDVVEPQSKIPKNRRALEADPNYGKPSWVKGRVGRRVDIDDAWERKNIRYFTAHTGKKVRMHRLAGAEFVRLFALACEASGYTPKSVQTYNPRVIGGTDRLSMHAYGIAFDVDPQDNPWGGIRKDGSPSLVRQHPEFMAVFEKAGWTWGGRWRKGKGDDMHAQRCGT
jgi:hypothetical protein